MKLRSFYRILILILLCLSINAIFTIPVSLAANSMGSAAGQTGFDDVNQFDPYSSKGTSAEIVDNTINKAGGMILSVLRIFTFCLAIIMLIVMGIRYVSASPRDRAELRKNLAGDYILWVVILFGASGILSLISTFANGVF